MCVIEQCSMSGFQTRNSGKMTSAAELLVKSLAKSREQGDITLKCEGEDIKAHSFILKER